MTERLVHPDWLAIQESNRRYAQQEAIHRIAARHMENTIERVRERCLAAKRLANDNAAVDADLLTDILDILDNKGTP